MVFMTTFYEWFYLSIAFLLRSILQIFARVLFMAGHGLTCSLIPFPLDFRGFAESAVHNFREDCMNRPRVERVNTCFPLSAMQCPPAVAGKTNFLCQEYGG